MFYGRFIDGRIKQNICKEFDENRALFLVLVNLILVFGGSFSFLKKFQKNFYI